MFNLIVTILALVLMIGAAIAGLTYLGPAFLNAQVKANVATLLNGGLQIQGAEALYRSDNGGTTGTAVQITDNSAGNAYLTQLPVVPSAVAGTNGWTIVPGTPASGNTPATPDQAVVTLSGNAGAIAKLCNYVSGQTEYGCTSGNASFFFNL